jgi:hypothetical protein
MGGGFGKVLILSLEVVTFCNSDLRLRITGAPSEKARKGCAAVRYGRSGRKMSRDLSRQAPRGVARDTGARFNALGSAGRRGSSAACCQQCDVLNTSGLDLVYALLDGYDATIVIDAAPRPDDPPGTLYVLEPQLENIHNSSPPLIEAHSMDPMKVLIGRM